SPDGAPRAIRRQRFPLKKHPRVLYRTRKHAKPSVVCTSVFRSWSFLLGLVEFCFVPFFARTRFVETHASDPTQVIEKSHCGLGCFLRREKCFSKMRKRHDNV